jgi:hypothetical protein
MNYSTVSMVIFNKECDVITRVHSTTLIVHDLIERDSDEAEYLFLKPYNCYDVNEADTILANLISLIRH